MPQTYFEDQTVFIDNFDDYEPTADIYYTLDGEDPTDQDALYDHTEGILLEDGNGPITLKAIAIDGEEESDITTAEYVFPLNVDNLEQLRQQTLGGLYRVDNPAVFIGGDSFRNTKFFQDNSGFGIQIDDDGGVIETEYNIGDQVAELVGTLGQHQDQLRFSPALDPGDPIDTGVEVEPLERTLDDLTQDDQSRLVLVYTVEFEEAGENFGGGGSTTNITDPSITGFEGLYRNVFGDSDITDSPIPMGPVNITGIIQENNDGLNLAARSLADFEEVEIEDPLLNASPTTLSDLNYIEGEGPSDPKSFELTGDNLDETDVTITAPDNFEISENGAKSFSTTITLTEYDGSAKTIWVRLEAGLSVDTYSGNVNITGGGADPINVAVSGEVTEPPPGLPYAEDFVDFVSVETLVEGWTLDNDYTYQGDFGSGSAGGLRGNGVLGFQLTGTGINSAFTATLILQNNTGSTITELFIEYTGKVARTDQTGTPKWIVSLNGTEYSELEYSTADGIDKVVGFLITDLSIPDGETFEIEWFTTATGTSGVRRQIGVTDVFIDLEEPDPIELTIWQGNNSDWFETDNWSDGVPTAGLDALIPGGLDHYPTIDTSADVQNLTLEDGATLLDNENLTVHGTLTMQRTIPFDGWRMISSPVSGQTIVGSDFAPEAPLPSYFDFYYFDENVNDAPWINLRKAEGEVNEALMKSLFQGRDTL